MPMKDEQTPRPSPAATRPKEMLREFVQIFHKRGWLNQNIRIAHSNSRYWIFCNETSFHAYRINDHCHLPPGVPGWLVCIVKADRIINDSEMSPFTSTEPSAQDWINCIVNDNFELI